MSRSDLSAQYTKPTGTFVSLSNFMLPPNSTPSAEPPGPVRSLSTQRNSSYFDSGSSSLFPRGSCIDTIFSTHHDHKAAKRYLTFLFDRTRDLDPNVRIILISILIQARDIQAVSRVKRLIQEVEQTPKDERRAYLLERGRRSTIIESPSPSSHSRPSSSPFSLLILDPSCSRVSPPLDSIDKHSPHEIFVDASATGIGFWFRRRWLAWEFKHPGSNRNIPTDRNRRIIISWAELIAVELGVLTLISAGYIYTSIVVRSDNRGVVVALERGTWKKEFGLHDVLARILKMCRRFHLELQMKWVDSKDNPADGPSRRVFPPMKMRFGRGPVIPDHLDSIVQEV